MLGANYDHEMLTMIFPVTRPNDQFVILLAFNLMDFSLESSFNLPKLFFYVIHSQWKTAWFKFDSDSDCVGAC